MDGPSRRVVLATGAALALAACDPSPSHAPARPDPDLVLRRRAAREIGGLVEAYAAVVAAFPAAAAPLSGLAAEHQAHVRALAGPPPASPSAAASTSPSSSASPTAAPTPGPVPATLPAARAWLAGLERAGADRRTAESLRAGPDLARLLAAVGACERTHAALLAAAGSR